MGIEPVSAARDAAAPDKTMFALGDLPGGRPLTFVGRVPISEVGNGQITFRATLSNGTEITPAVRRSPGSEHSGLPALFGARRILGLEQLMSSRYGKNELTDRLRRLGYDVGQVSSEKGTAASPSLYPENQPDVTSESLKPLLVKESLRYGILCAETAFIATRKEAGVPVAVSVLTANAIPSGWVEEGAAGIDWMMAAPAAAVAGGYGRARVQRAPTGGAAYAAPPSPSPASPRSFLRGFGSSLNARKQRSSPMQGAAAYEVTESASQQSSAPLFEGIPMFADGTAQAVLYDSVAEGSVVLPDNVTFMRLEIQFPAGALDAAGLGAGLSLLLYVEDLTAPRARVRISDLLRQGGVRPLNLLRGAGQRIYLVLSDEEGVWENGNAPAITVTLR